MDGQLGVMNGGTQAAIRRVNFPFIGVLLPVKVGIIVIISSDLYFFGK
jgi:hypothetical protein